MANGWLSTDCDGAPVISRLDDIIVASTNATLANITADLVLQARWITTKAHLEYAVEQAVIWCTAHDPIHTVPGPPAYTLGLAAHLSHVKHAWDAIQGPVAGHDWGTCLGELEHGGDTGTEVEVSEISQLPPLSVQLSFDPDDYQNDARMARIIKMIRMLNGGRPGRPGDPDD